MGTWRRYFLLIGFFTLTACTGIGNRASYDPNAKETMVRVVEKTVAATDVQQARGGASTLVPIPIRGAMIFIPIMLSGAGPKLTVYEYVVAYPDGRKLSVYSDYPHFEKGGCVKVFESEWKTYPRIAPGWDCK